MVLDSVLMSHVGSGSHRLRSLPSAGFVERQSTVARSVKVERGVSGIDSGGCGMIFASITNASYRCQTRSDMTNETENYVTPYLARDEQQTPRTRPEPQPTQQIPQPASPLTTINQMNRDFDNWANVGVEADTTTNMANMTNMTNIFEDDFRRFTGIEQTGAGGGGPGQNGHPNQFQLPPLRFDENNAGTTFNTIPTAAEGTPSPPTQPVSPGLTASVSEGAEERERRNQMQDYLPRARSALSEVLTVSTEDQDMQVD